MPQLAFDPAAILPGLMVLLFLAVVGVAIIAAVVLIARQVMTPEPYGKPPRWIVRELERRVQRVETAKKFDEVLRDLAEPQPLEEDLDE